MTNIRNPNCVCVFCRKTFYRSPSMLKKNKSFHCSQACREMDIPLSLHTNGYLVIGRTKIHRAVMEYFLGRQLKSNEFVHHINSDKLDNRIENLSVVTASSHGSIHNPLRIVLDSICLVCRKKFHVNPAVKSRGHGKYCSKECRIIGQRRERQKIWKTKRSSK
jgi:hypothetical protein